MRVVVDNTIEEEKQAEENNKMQELNEVARFRKQVLSH